ncbi:MAG: hypothetical protein RJA70_4776 [Pseudomonadota bacterium]|jgi:predicted Zn finger-like uncharacterized protein
MSEWAHAWYDLCTMRVSCRKCPAKYTISDDKVRGRRVKIKCKRCGSPIIIEGGSLPPSAISESEPPASEALADSVPPSTAAAAKRSSPPPERRVASQERQATPFAREAPRPRVDDVPRDSLKERHSLDALASTLDQRVGGPPSYAPPQERGAVASDPSSDPPAETASPGRAKRADPADSSSGQLGPSNQSERLLASLAELSFDDETVAMTQRELLAAADAIRGTSEPPAAETPLHQPAPGVPVPRNLRAQSPLTKSAGDALRATPKNDQVSTLSRGHLSSHAAEVNTPVAARAALNPNASLTSGALAARDVMPAPPPAKSGAGWWLLMLSISVTGLAAGALTTEAGRARFGAVLGVDAPAAPAFNTEALKPGWLTAEATAARCLQPGDDALSGSVRVRFSAAGDAAEVATSGELTRSKQLDCVLQAFRSIRVPAYSGPVAIVKKTVKLKSR